MVFSELDVPSRICLGLTSKFFAGMSSMVSTELNDLPYLLSHARPNKMCAIETKTYRNCRVTPQHRERGQYLRCADAEARPDRKLCVPPTGKLRDLPLSLDVQNINLPGDCPISTGDTPANSSD